MVAEGDRDQPMPIHHNFCICSQLRSRLLVVVVNDSFPFSRAPSLPVCSCKAHSPAVFQGASQLGTKLLRNLRSLMPFPVTISVAMREPSGTSQRPQPPAGITTLFLCVYHPPLTSHPQRTLTTRTYLHTPFHYVAVYLCLHSTLS